MRPLPLNKVLKEVLLVEKRFVKGQLSHYEISRRPNVMHPQAVWVKYWFMKRQEDFWDGCSICRRKLGVHLVIRMNQPYVVGYVIDHLHEENLKDDRGRGPVRGVVCDSCNNKISRCERSKLGIKIYEDYIAAKGFREAPSLIKSVK